MIAKFQPFRKHRSLDEPSWVPVIFVGLLIAFNLGLWSYIFVQLWKFSR